MEAALRTFFTSPRFAVVGASSDPTKYGHKVFVWYLSHGLPVDPINPRASEITINRKKISTIASPSKLTAPAETSLSIITPPKATMQVLKEAKDAGVPAVWLQPGTYDDQVMEFARKEFKAAIGGIEGNTNGEEGWCVLVDGEDGLEVAGRKWERTRL